MARIRAARLVFHGFRKNASTCLVSAAPVTGRSRSRTARCLPSGSVPHPGPARALETSHPDLHAINLEEVLSYLLKGAGEAAAAQFHLKRLEAAGRVIGKRCGTSQNIGPTARTKGAHR